MTKKKAYVVGNNVHKSLSPLIFNYWFEKYEVDGEYSFKEIDEQNFNKEIRSLFEEVDVCGLNITIPFKEKIIQHLDEIDEHTKLIGAANCVSKTNTRLTGSNTDWIGFKECIKHIEQRESAIVVGYGGSSKAVVYALSLMGFKKIRVFNRSYEKIKKIKNIIPHKLEELEDFLSTGNIVINTIPKKIVESLVTDKTKKEIKKNNCYGFDLVYNYPTLFLNFFNETQRVYGVEMLAHQAAPCFYKWFGIFPDVERNLIQKLKKQ